MKTILFPLIQVKDKAQRQQSYRRVGSDTHDSLCVDRETGALHYYNLQCGEGTGGDFEFEDEVRLVELRELIEIAMEELDVQSLPDNGKRISLAFFQFIVAYHHACTEREEIGRNVYSRRLTGHLRY